MSQAGQNRGWPRKSFSCGTAGPLSAVVLAALVVARLVIGAAATAGPPNQGQAAQAEKQVSGPVLVPGAGFTEPTPSPADRGTGDDAETKVIARWDVVPYQTFDTQMQIGIVAFHSAGIEKVSFSANGGAWIDVPQPTRNSETKVVEYWVTVRAADFPDGLLEVRAIATPRTGRSRVLQGDIPFVTTSNTETTNGEHSLWLFANSKNSFVPATFYVAGTSGSESAAGTSEQPVKTLGKALTLAGGARGGRVVIVEAGQYRPDRATLPIVQNERWIVVEPAPGLDRSQVEIAGDGQNDRLQPRVGRIHWRNLTFRPDTYSYINESSATRGANQWYDACLIKAEMLEPRDVPPWRSNVWATDCRVENFAYGVVNALLARNCVVKDALDAYQRSQAVIQCEVESMRMKALAHQHHPDVYQTWGEMQNIVVYGLKGEDIDGTQVLFINQPIKEGATMTDAAFVDWDVFTDDPRGGPPFTQFQGVLNNVLFQNVKVPRQRFLFRTEAKMGLNALRASQVVFDDCEFGNGLGAGDLPPGITVR
ncbi:MAG: hypothetical protein JSS02_06485 [Planctomycetes bacterium]|nr:hypothetical protein [Planctomycetota bacterium]